MKAIRIGKHGPVSDIGVAEVSEPEVGPDEVRVRMEAAAINPSDVGCRLGWFPGFPLPRILGRDFAGTVIEGPSELLGVPVWGSGGDLGYSREGTHAETIVIPKAAVVRRPARADEIAAGVRYLVSEAAGYVTGQTLNINGGAFMF